jgi:hypothetical protein
MTGGVSWQTTRGQPSQEYFFWAGKKYHGVVLVDYGLEVSDTVIIGNILSKFRKSLLLNPTNQPTKN